MVHEKRWWAGALAAALSLAPAAAAAKEHDASSTGESKHTLTKLHAANQSEVKAGTWMKEHATNDRVKDFAGKMVDEHTKMDKDVLALAKDKGIDLTSAPAGKSDDKAHLDQLKNMQGAQADREYMRMMVDDHQKDLKEVRDAHAKATRSKGDDELAKLLADAQDKISHHLEDARDVQKALQGGAQARTPRGASSGSTGMGSGADTSGAGTSGGVGASSGPGASGGGTGTSGMSGTTGSSTSTSDPNQPSATPQAGRGHDGRSPDDTKSDSKGR